MKQRVLVFLVLPIIGMAVWLYIWQANTIPSITYFPMDHETSFEKALTRLEMLTQKGNDSYELIWESSSKSEKEIYLRQDISLLFDNGRLKGMHSNWKENADTIEMKEKLSAEDSNYFQTITYHHGEIHYPDDQIKSIQLMTYDQLYIIDSPNTPLKSFKKPANSDENEWEKLLDHTTHQQLLYSWKQLLNHFQIDIKNYHALPLTNLYNYNAESLAPFTQEQTNQIIGQLWEGLYKNYFMDIKSLQNERSKSYIPLILFDKNDTHLIVLYEINGEKKKLIQRYPDFKKQDR